MGAIEGLIVGEDVVGILDGDAVGYVVTVLGADDGFVVGVLDGCSVTKGLFVGVVVGFSDGNVGWVDGDKDG